MGADNHQALRDKVAAEYGIAQYRRYAEKEVPGLIGHEISWYKRHRKAGKILYVRDPGNGIFYFGYMLCDILILGKDAVNRNEPPPGAT